MRFHSVPLVFSSSSPCRLITPHYFYCDFEFFIFFPNIFSPCTNIISLLHMMATAAAVAFKSPNTVTGRRRLRRWQRRNNRALGEYIICTQSSSASPLNGIIFILLHSRRVARVRVAAELPLNCVSGVYSSFVVTSAVVLFSRPHTFEIVFVYASAYNTTTKIGHLLISLRLIPNIRALHTLYIYLQYCVLIISKFIE